MRRTSERRARRSLARIRFEHKDDQQTQQPTAHFHNMDTFFQNHRFHVDTYNQSFFHADFFLSFVNGLYVDYRTVYAMATGASGSVMGINLHAEGIDNGTRALENKIEAVNAKVEAIQPEVSITMIHEVAVTQKILVIGINQFF